MYSQKLCREHLVPRAFRCELSTLSLRTHINRHGKKDYVAEFEAYINEFGDTNVSTQTTSDLGSWTLKRRHALYKKLRNWQLGWIYISRDQFTRLSNLGLDFSEKKYKLKEDVE